MALRLIQCTDRDLPELLATAVHLKEQFKPGVITYSRKVFLPLTNLCRDYCGYCIFRRDPGQPGAHTMTPDEVLRVAREGERLGCREALFSLGDKPELVFPGNARHPAPPRLQIHAALPGSDVRTGAARDRAHSPRQSRPDERAVAAASARGIAQPRPDAGNHQRQAHATGGPSRRARQGSGAAAWR